MNATINHSQGCTSKLILGVAVLRIRPGATTDQKVECSKDIELSEAEKRRFVEKRGTISLEKRELETGMELRLR